MSKIWVNNLFSFRSLDAESCARAQRMESALHAAERALELCGQRGEDLEREAETNRTSKSMFWVVLNEFHISKEKILEILTTYWNLTLRYDSVSEMCEALQLQQNFQEQEAAEELHRRQPQPHSDLPTCSFNINPRKDILYAIIYTINIHNICLSI